MNFVDIVGDLHFCGRCESQFSLIISFIEHRNTGCVVVAGKHLSEDEVRLAGCGRTAEAELAQWLTLAPSGEAAAPLTSAEGATAAVLSDAALLRTVVVPGGAEESAPVPDSDAGDGGGLQVLLKLEPPRLQLPNPYLMEEPEREDDPTPTETTPAPAGRPLGRKRAPRSKKYECEQCGHRCAFPKDLKRHKFCHQNATFPCGECSRVYNRPDKLQTHRRLAHGAAARLACPEPGCRHSSSTRDQLRKHMRDRHSDLRPFQCQLCSYSAKQSHTLTVHLMSHTGEAPFACSEPECERRFRTGSDLRRHLRHHTGERRHRCPHCGLAAASRGNLTKHMRAKHGAGTAAEAPSGTDTADAGAAGAVPTTSPPSPSLRPSTRQRSAPALERRSAEEPGDGTTFTGPVAVPSRQTAAVSVRS